MTGLGNGQAGWAPTGSGGAADAWTDASAPKLAQIIVLSDLQQGRYTGTLSPSPQDRPNEQAQERTETMTNPTREEVNSRLEAVEARIETRLTSIEGKIDVKLASVDARFEKIDARFDALTAKLDAGFAMIGQRMDGLTDQVRDAKAAAMEAKTEAADARKAAVGTKWNIFMTAVGVTAVFLAAWAIWMQGMELVAQFLGGSSPPGQ